MGSRYLNHNGSSLNSFVSEQRLIINDYVFVMSLRRFILFLPFLSLACQAHQAHLNSVPSSNSATPFEVQSPNPQAPAPVITPTPEHEVSFGRGLRIVPRNIQLKNESRRYRIDALYPQVEGSKSRGIQTLNQRIKSLVTENYQWLLIPPTREDRQSFQKWPGVFNSVDLDYEVILATDKLLSIYFDVYTYGIGAAHSVQQSFTVNFDVSSDKSISLTSLFKSKAKALGFISDSCMEEVSNQLLRRSDPQFVRELAPTPENYKSWNITKTGLRFNFDACRLGGCAEGKQVVEIEFESLREMLNPRGPLSSLASSD